MNRIWLRCLVVDRASGKVVDKLDDYPLPAALALKHLWSYLDQRFGSPLAQQAAEGIGVTFRAPRPFDQKEAALIAIPLLLDARTRERVPLLERLAQVNSLVSSLGATEVIDAARLQEREPWRGTFFDPAFLRRRADDAAARASRAWLLASGLLREVDEIRKGGSQPAIPAPGLARLLDAANRAAQRAASSADAAGRLFDELAELGQALTTNPSPSSAAVRRAREGEGRLLRVQQEALTAAQETERLTRSMAQLALGVSACAASSDRIERLDRAAVAVLHPPEGQGWSGLLVRDGLAFASESHEELPIEIAGLMCRMLLDRRVHVELAAPGPRGGPESN